MGRRSLAAFVSAVLLGGAIGLGAGPAGVVPVLGATSVRGTPAQLLARLVVELEHRGGYERSLFVTWADADRDGCNTRAEALIAEASVKPAVGAHCRLSGGRWRSVYDGLVTTSTRALEIDHVVALKEAWDSGAWRWSAATRNAFANDLGDSRTLRAVSIASNQAKGDKDPSNWLPPVVSFRCTYVSDWIAIKVRWRLSVDPSEGGRLRRLVAGCPARITSVTLASVRFGAAIPPASAPSTGAPSAPIALVPPSSSCDPAYTGFCVPVVSYDLDCADIRHKVWVVPGAVDRHRFDSDGDGVGCESYPG